MATPKNKILSAVEMLRKCKKEVGAELSGYDHFQIRTNTVLDQLINILSNASGVSGNAGDKPPVFKPVTSIFGSKIAQASTEPVAKAEPSIKEETAMQEATDEAFAMFQIMDVGAIRKTFNDLTIRAVARKAGMGEVTATTPAKINLDFIRTIMKAVETKALEIKQTEEADNASKATQTQDHIVTEEDLVNNPELEGQGVKVGDTIQIPATAE